jgi:hypothetical protein
MARKVELKVRDPDPERWLRIVASGCSDELLRVDA